jgi:hypothetical protein
MSSQASAAPRILTDAELRQAGGGLLLPAIQKVREAAARTGLLLPAVQRVAAAPGGVIVASGDVDGDGRSD